LPYTLWYDRTSLTELTDEGVLFIEGGFTVTKKECKGRNISDKRASAGLKEVKIIR
jgi:hypothetical protein